MKAEDTHLGESLRALSLAACPFCGGDDVGIEPVCDDGESEDDIDLDAPLTAAEEEAYARREPVEQALLRAEEIAKAAGETVLADCLARLGFFWDIGQAAHAKHLLDKAQRQVLTQLRGVRVDGGAADAEGAPQEPWPPIPERKEDADLVAGLARIQGIFSGEGVTADTGTVHDPGDGSVPTYFPGPGETDALEGDNG